MTIWIVPTRQGGMGSVVDDSLPGNKGMDQMAQQYGWIDSQSTQGQLLVTQAGILQPGSNTPNGLNSSDPNVANLWKQQQQMQQQQSTTPPPTTPPTTPQIPGPPSVAPGVPPPPGALPPPPSNIDPTTLPPPGGMMGGQLPPTVPGGFLQPRTGGPPQLLAGGPPTGLTGTNPDESIINSTAAQQYNQSQNFIAQDAAARAAARSQLAQALTGQAESQFKFNLPSTLEDLNANHLLNSTALEQEIGRQQAQIAADVAGQTGVLGAQDIATTSAQRAAALGSLQSTDIAGINRNFSLADFQKQADLAQQLGAQAAPQVGGGKGAVGTTLSGIGSLAPLVGVATGNPLLGLGASLAANIGGNQVATGPGGIPVNRGQTANYSGGGK